MKQIMERLLAKMGAEVKEDIRTDQERMEAKIQANNEKF
jgi:hypothetical protein